MKTQEKNIDKNIISFKYILNNKYNWKFSFIVLCVCCFFENLIITGSATVVLSTIEKEFFLTSTKSGLFLGIFELAAFISSPLFGFFGSIEKINKLKLISLSLFLITIGSYLIGFTVFIKEPFLNFISNVNQTHETNLNLCFSSNQYFNSTEQNKSENFDFFIYIGHFIIGLGSVAIYTVGIAYIEEITLKSQSPYCQAILYGTGSIGGGIGFLVTGQFLNINARFYSSSYEPNKWITPQNTYWIGAWWLPYLIYGTICFSLFVFVFFFSYKSFDKKYLPKNENKEDDKKKILLKKELIQDTKLILKNLKLISITLSTITEGIILKGFLGFMSKYIEYQFDMSASNSTIALGSVALVSVVLGTLLSAYLINRFKLEGKGCSILAFLLFFFTSFCFLILLNYCPETRFNSIECPQCNCDNKFNPVCFSDFNNGLVQFQSACHAGCLKTLENNQFTNCTCLENHFNTSVANVILSIQNCEKKIKCVDKLVINGIAAFLIVLFTAMSVIPHLKALLACVDEMHQSLALGVRNAFVGVVGNFVGTILVGQAVDLTCKYWQKNAYNQKVCKLYDNYSMSFSLAFIGFGCRLFSAIFMIYPCYKFIKERRINKSQNKSIHLDDIKF